jgi:hypothetical protein
MEDSFSVSTELFVCLFCENSGVIQLSTRTMAQLWLLFVEMNT